MRQDPSFQIRALAAAAMLALAGSIPMRTVKLSMRYSF